MRSLLFMAFSSFGTVMAASSYGENNEQFVIYYSDKAPLERFSRYHLMVLDRIYHPPLTDLLEDGKTLLGYISLGEMEKASPYFNLLKQNGLILKENKNWKGRYFIDIRNPLWQKLVIGEIVPDTLRQGFEGVFFDTLDNPIELERSNPAKYRGMTEAAVHFIKAVRMHYPRIKIMVNRAYPILPRVAFDIDMALGECVAGGYDFGGKRYTRVAPALYRQQVDWLKQAKAANPALQVYTLDYADTSNSKDVAGLYRLQRSNGFIPYVASVGVDELAEEPELKASIFQ